MSNTDKEIEKMSQKILLELETVTSADLRTADYANKMLVLSDLNHTKNVLMEIQDASKKHRADIEKRAVIKALLYSTWLQRLYFIIRSALMGIIGTLFILVIVAYLGTIDVYMEVILNVSVFLVALIVTRLFDAQMAAATKNIIGRLGNHKRIRSFIMNHM
jgi:hypothetical protein